MKTNFALIKFHDFSYTELETMIPWEREVYTHLVAQHVHEQQKEAENN